MSTNDYLASLNEDQLEFARERINVLLSAKRDEKKLLVWVVHDDFVNLKFFKEGDYISAAEFLLNKATQNAKNGRCPDDCELHLTSAKFIQPEYDELFN